MTRKDGDVEYHYIDAKTYLPVKVAVERTARGTKIQSETRLGDYRKIGAGYLWPFLLESGAAGRSERQRMKLKDVEVDPVIDDSRFAMPLPRRFYAIRTRPRVVTLAVRSPRPMPGSARRGREAPRRDRGGPVVRRPLTISMGVASLEGRRGQSSS